ncbi:MAG: glycosyltransferase [Romboutsia sp.]|uniref:glycosyltransferase n=1 Tax=Romboutsia sp. TaxID=1965302 RepID=UPI003F3908A0
MDKVSVIMPCFNDGLYICESIESVCNQTYKNIELIIVDDGSTDETTCDVLKSLTKENIIKVQTPKSKGPAYARNVGIKIATGKYILCLDSDDLIDPTYIEKAVTAISQNSNVGIVYCNAQLFGAINKPLELPPYSLDTMLKRNLIFVTALFKKSDWEKVNGFDESFVHGLEDYDFWLSLISLSIEIIKLPEVLFFYRKKESSRNKTIVGNKTLHDETLARIHEKHKDLFILSKNQPVKSPVKKIFVCMYLVHNLGDDLFLDTLVKKYPYCQFTINYISSDYDNFISNYTNLNRIVGVRDYNKIGLEYDAIIYIGGSLFQEVAISHSIYQTRMNIIDQFKKRNKPVFMLGTNFGPYSTNEFFDMYEDFLKGCYDTCVRDKYSYNLLNHLPNVRYAPDIALQSNFFEKHPAIKNSNTIGFSIMNFKKRDDLHVYHDKYVFSICESIKALIDLGYSCCLMSFCSLEGDMDTINEIKSKLSSKYLEHVSDYDYTNNLDESIKLISKFKLFVATRFHATIISLGLGVNVLPIVYNIKTLNVLKDLNLDKLAISVDNLDLLYDKTTLNSAFTNNYFDKNINNNSIHHFDKLSLFISDLDTILNNIPNNQDILNVIYDFLDNKISIDGLIFYLKNGTNLDSEKINYILSNIKFIAPRSTNITISNNPLISIIIPVYNGSRTIEHTLDSILMQSYKNIEIIIIDDNSTDNSNELISTKYKLNSSIKYYKNISNVDVGMSRLIGYNMCSGDYIIFIDQDDFYIDPDFFKKCLSIFNNYENVSLVACNTFIYYEDKNICKSNKLNLPFKIDREEYFMNLQSPNYPKPTSTFPVMYNKKILENVKLSELEFIGDSSLYQRALLTGNPIILDATVGVYRIHKTNSTYIVGPQFVINTLNGHISTKKLAIEEFCHDSNEINNWMNLKADVSIGWYLNTHVITYENALHLLNWVNKNNISLSDSNITKLENALKV